MAGGSAESVVFRRKEEENKPFIFTNQWAWWVIFANSIILDLALGF